MSPKQLQRRKLLILSLIAVTAVGPLVFVRFDAPTWQLNLMLGLAKAGSLPGTVLLLWQFVLGFRGNLARLMPDHAWQISVHKILGEYGSYLILLHPVFITVYYWRRHDVNLFRWGRMRDFDIYVLVGLFALAILFYLVISSVYARQRQSFAGWFFTHLSSYLLFPAVMIHSFAIGSTVRGTWLWAGWLVMATVAAGLFVFRLIHSLGTFSRRYRVARVIEVAAETSEITLQPDDGAYRPGIGDFIYVRSSVWERSHPYTVSRYDEERRSLAITVKALGPTSAEFQNLKPGTPLLVDGTYGVFTNEAYVTDQRVVVLAGGIGITPFLRLLEYMERHPERESWIFYANETFQDIAYRDFLDALKHTRVIHVLEKGDNFSDETGIIDIDMLKKYLGPKLAESRYFLCGPPAMINSLREQLREAGTPPDQVHYELFSE